MGSPGCNCYYCCYNACWAGSGKLTRSMVTWPMTPLSKSTEPMARDIVIRFICGRLVWGKKQPALMYSFAANLSKDPISSMLPSGSMKKAMDGLARVLG